jgi:hypothetical protein
MSKSNIPLRQNNPSPNRSENPFLFFFKKEKIATDSWK